jgi:hypothetical protein
MRWGKQGSIARSSAFAACWLLSFLLLVTLLSPPRGPDHNAGQAAQVLASLSDSIADDDLNSDTESQLLDATAYRPAIAVLHPSASTRLKFQTGFFARGEIRRASRARDPPSHLA